MTPGLPYSPLPETVHLRTLSSLVQPGSVGGSFSARTQHLSVTLPSLHNDYYVPARGYRKQPVASNRYVPTERRLTPNHELSPRDRHRMENEMLHDAQERNRKSSYLSVPHRSEQEYFMAGSSLKLLHRSMTLPEIPRGYNVEQTPSLPPQSSLVYEERSGSRKSHASTLYSRKKHSLTPGASEAFMTQTGHPIVMDEITVRKCQNYRSPCSLLGRDSVLELSRRFKAISLQADTVPYSLAEELVSESADPSFAVQVMDVNKDGLVDMCEYIVVISLAAHLYPNAAIDFSKLDAKLNSLKRKFEELQNATMSAVIHSISKLLIEPSIMQSIFELVNCSPDDKLSYLEYLCVYKFWSDLESSVLDDEIFEKRDVNAYVTSYVGQTDSTFSFADLVSSTDLLS